MKKQFKRRKPKVSKKSKMVTFMIFLRRTRKATAKNKQLTHHNGPQPTPIPPLPPAPRTPKLHLLLHSPLLAHHHRPPAAISQLPPFLLPKLHHRLRRKRQLPPPLSKRSSGTTQSHMENPPRRMVRHHQGTPLYRAVRPQ